MDGIDDMDDRTPETQPSGALVPPPRVPPTAVATSAPLPPRPVPPRHGATRVTHRRVSISIPLLEAALDGLDALGDRIADAVGLRQR